jgi:superfamily I DNA/RNA helicase/DNA polymerase III epsilon subunit-like protein
VTLLVPTTRQREAIEAPLGPVLVLAGPGAGKTLCLIERIRYLVEQQRFAPARICAVTFTNKAAGEIAHRLRDALGGAADQVTRSTIHALCVQLLREHGSEIGVPRGFGIADEEYQRQVLRRAGFRKDKRWPLHEFGLHRMSGKPLDDWLARLYERYREILDARGLLDFDDLVVQTEVLLRTREDAATAIAARWDYLLVDEGQDLSPTQYAILARLWRPHRNIFLVGDDEQAIYAWAGADPAMLATFLNDYGIALPIILDENRRCSQQIFEAARRLIGHNPQRHVKSLRATRISPWPVTAQSFGDEEEEGEWLVADILGQRQAHGLEWGDFALLYRKHEIGDRLEARLVEAGIPCQLAQGRAIADDPVVQYLLAALRVITAPDDPIFAERFAKVVLPRTLYATLRADADREGVEFRDWLRNFGRTSPRTDENGRKVRRCLVTLSNLAVLKDRHLNLATLVEELLAQRVGQYRTMLEEKYEEAVLSDPAGDSAARALGARLAGALHGRGRVWLPRLGGAELGLAGLLREAGMTMVDYLGAGATPRVDDVVIGMSDRSDRFSLALTIFKALQLVHEGDLAPPLADFIAVDIETNELNPDTCEVIEFAAVQVESGRIIHEFHSLVRPERPVSPAATAIHHYTDADLVNAPDFATVWGRFRAFAGNALLIAHNGHGFDFPVLRRLADHHPAGNQFSAYDSLVLARDLHPGSRKLGDLARAFGIDPGLEHHALDDTRTLAWVMSKLEDRKLARARTTSLGTLLDDLAIAQVLLDPAELGEEDKSFLDVGRIFALGRYTQSLARYDAERTQPGGEVSPDVEQLIERLGGRDLMQKLRREKSAADRYPVAMGRLRRLIEAAGAGTLREQLERFLERVALSQSRGGPEVDRDRVNLLTLHSTKGLEFSRVYVVGVEDAQLPGAPPGKEPSAHEVEEGRRLLYVGMTRAMDRLVLTRVRNRNGIAAGGTRYLSEIGLVGEEIELPIG